MLFGGMAKERPYPGPPRYHGQRRHRRPDPHAGRGTQAASGSIRSTPGSSVTARSGRRRRPRSRTTVPDADRPAGDDGRHRRGDDRSSSRTTRSTASTSWSTAAGTAGKEPAQARYWWNATRSRGSTRGIAWRQTRRHGTAARITRRWGSACAARGRPAISACGSWPGDWASPPSLISQIETGRANPSVNTLYAIAAELDVSLDELLFTERRPAEMAEASDSTDASESMAATSPRVGAGAGRPGATETADPAGMPLQRAATRQRIRLASGVLWERLTSVAEPGVEFLHVTYEVGGASSPPDAFQRHPGHEWGYVISGRLKVKIGFDEYILGPGDAISLNSSIPHRLSDDRRRARACNLVRPRPRPVRRPDPDRGRPRLIDSG